MVYTVWLFTRPLSFFPSFGITSDGKPALRHWGVLISELTLLDVQVIMQRTRGSLEEDTTLGTMYELFPEEGYGNVHIIRPFGILRIRNEWHSFSAQYIGTTLITLQMIDHEAARIVAEHPDFRLFENNCQNFVKFLLGSLCPGASVPDTVKDISQRLLDITNVAHTYRDLLPGAYPASIASSTSTSYLTATGTTWLTASGDEWVTAVEYFSSQNSSYNQSLTGIPLVNRNEGVAIFKIAQRVLKGKTAIVRAVTAGDVHEVAALLRINADLSVPDKLLDAGADPSALNVKSNKTPLHLAVENRNMALCEMLLEAGANPFSTPKIPSTDSFSVTEDGDTPMDIAVYGNDLGMVRLLLLNPSSEASSTALDLGHPLCLAAEHGYLEILSVLLEAGAAMAADINSFALTAVEHGDSEMLKLFLDAGADPEYPTVWKRTLLHAAVERVQVDMVATLLAAGANPAVAEKWYGFTPLHEAVHRYQYAKSVVQSQELIMIMRLLLYGNVEAPLGGSVQDMPPDVAPSPGESLSQGRRLLLLWQNKAGFNPLHLAIMNHFTDAVLLLLNAGSDPSGPTRDGYPPIFLALSSQTIYFEWTDIALEELDKARSVMRSEITARHNQDSLLQILLRFRPNLSVRLVDETPWMVAVQWHQASFQVIKKLSSSCPDTSNPRFTSLYYCGLAKLGFDSVDEGAENSNLSRQGSEPFVLNFNGAVKDSSVKMMFSEHMGLVFFDRRLGNHSDECSLAKLWIDETCRLEIEIRNGEHCIKPVPGNDDNIDYDRIWRIIKEGPYALS